MKYDLSRLRSQLISASVDMCAFRCGVIMGIEGDADRARATEIKLQDLLDRSYGVAIGQVEYRATGG